jgi:hypothetical protein
LVAGFRFIGMASPSQKRGTSVALIFLTLAVIVSVAVIAFLYSRMATNGLQVNLRLPETPALPNPSPMPNPQPTPLPVPG